MPFSRQFTKTAAGLSVCVLLLAKLALAAHLDLIGDEAFYWQASQRLALAYSDEPFVTALMVGLGTSVVGKSVLGVRLFFLLLGCALPLAIYALANPLVGRDDAILAALTSLTMPFGAVLGVFAVPDVALALLTVLGLTAFERATRTGRNTCWMAFGVVTALGLSTHYRFILFVAAVAAYLLLTSKGRSLWRISGLWLAASTALLGLLPAALFNWTHDFVSVRFHFVERHPWRFDPSGLLHPIEQAAVVTPFLYAALLLTLFQTIRHSRDDDREAMIALFSGIPIVAFWLIDPWAVLEGFTVHWPLPGYLPLFVFLPSTLRRFRDTARTRLGASLPSASVALGACGVVLLFAFLGAALVPARFSSNAVVPDVRQALSGWSELGARTRALLAESDSTRVLVANDYVVGAELDFGVDSIRGVYVLDASRAARHGRSPQTSLWGLDEAGLYSHAGGGCVGRRRGNGL